MDSIQGTFKVWQRLHPSLVKELRATSESRIHRLLSVQTVIHVKVDEGTADEQIVTEWKDMEVVVQSDDLKWEASSGEGQQFPADHSELYHTRRRNSTTNLTSITTPLMLSPA